MQEEEEGNIKGKEWTSIKVQRLVRGTVKLDVLQGEKECPDIVALRIYNTIFINFLSMGLNSIEWVIKSKKVCNVDSVEVEHINLLRLNQVNNYYNTMRVVDMVDKLRGKYQPDHCLCNRKRWWAICNWSIRVHMVNEYTMYVNLNVQEGKRKKYLLSRNDFSKSIALS